MELINRMATKCRKIGTSHVVTIPWESRRDLGIKAGDQLLTYQFEDLLLVVPLRRLGETGLAKIVQQLRDLPSPTAP